MTTQSEYADENNKLITALSPRWMHSPKRIRVIFGGVAVADSTNAHLLREGGPPVYYFPEADARTDLLTPTSTVKNSPVRGDASYSSLTLNGRTADDAVWTFKEPAETASFLKGYLAFDWPKMDAWFEEREEVFVHARDPFKRIDTVKTDRKIHVVVGGETVAETTESVILLEPGHPIRYYLPMADVRLNLLTPSTTESRCAYKGTADYHSVVVNGETLEDAAWMYRYPTPEVSKIVGMLCFFNERVDAIYVDGDELPKPITNWRR
jgi:uncharacterized protein (DUF427 family)